jgi:hypothetical protein
MRFAVLFVETGTLGELRLVVVAAPVAAAAGAAGEFKVAACSIALPHARQGCKQQTVYFAPRRPGQCATPGGFAKGVLRVWNQKRKGANAAISRRCVRLTFVSGLKYTSWLN